MIKLTTLNNMTFQINKIETLTVLEDMIKSKLKCSINNEDIFEVLSLGQNPDLVFKYFPKELDGSTNIFPQVIIFYTSYLK